MRTRNILSLLGLITPCFFLVMAGVAQEPKKPESAAPPPPGKLVDVGGWRLHLNCTGKRMGNAPTVVLESGSGDFSFDWTLAQTRVARFARVCSYDRAGRAWSDLGPRPRTMRQVVYELHTALQRAGEKGPYVLVGQSLGGLLVRVYAREYPKEAAGVVLVDSTDEDTVMLLNNKRQRLRELSQGRTIPPIQTTISAAGKELSAEEKRLVEGNMKQIWGAGSPQIGPPFDRLPAETQAMRLWGLAQPHHYIADSYPYLAEEFAEIYAASQKQEYPLDNTPLAVLIRPSDEESRRRKIEFTKLSRNSKLIVAEKSGHHIQLDEPEVVTSAIQQVLEAIRSGALKPDGSRLSLPAPTGTYQIGRTALHLVDKNTMDSLAPTPRPREVMIQVWYPAGDSDRYPRALYKSPAVGRITVKRLNQASGAQFLEDFLSFPTHSRQGAPARSGKWPVLLLSPAAGTTAADYTGLNEDLASRGYVVVGIDHTFDAATVEFPGGRIETRFAGFDPERVMPFRLGDVRFVLDQLTRLAAGDNPDASRTAAPRGLGRALDLRRIGMFGHSLGSPTTARSMLEDRRIGSGVALDGSIPPKRPGRTPWGIEKKDLDRPFLLIGTVKHRRSVDKEGWRDFWEQMRAERLWLVIQGIGHYDFNDTGVFSEQIDLSKMFQEELMLGPSDGGRALAIVRAYLGAWFDQTLRGRSQQLLQGPSPKFPEVEFDR